MFRRLLSACFIAAAAAQPLIAQGGVTQSSATSLRDAIPLDPSVKMGVLPNGLRYYIQRHPQPAKRAELRLAVNAGGINEDDDQVGMAHLIEHMGFNGTTHFKKNDLIDYLRSVGVRFGADLNAGTSTDETVYMLQIPSDTARILEQGIIVLSDWASGSLFDSTEVANERGVVVEEWRGGQGAFGRMRRKMAPIMYKDSKYATRDVIGTDRSIMSATPALLKRFYNDWYRPDLQAVVVVGDVDVAAVEALIKKHFTAAPRPNPRPRIVVELPDNREPLVAVASDKEAPGTTVQIIIKLPRTTITTVGDYREQMLGNLFSAMLRSRFTEIAQKPDAPFVNAFGFKGSFTRGKGRLHARGASQGRWRRAWCGGAAHRSAACRAVRLFAVGARAREGVVATKLRAAVRRSRESPVGFPRERVRLPLPEPAARTWTGVHVQARAAASADGDVARSECAREALAHRRESDHHGAGA